MDICIALPYGDLKRSVSVRTGGGIIHDSDLRREYEETVHKAKDVLRTAEDPPASSVGRNLDESFQHITVSAR